MWLLRFLIWWHSNVLKHNVWLIISPDRPPLYMVDEAQYIEWDGTCWVLRCRFQEYEGD